MGNAHISCGSRSMNDEISLERLLIQLSHPYLQQLHLMVKEHHRYFRTGPERVARSALSGNRVTSFQFAAVACSRDHPDVTPIQL